MRMMINYIKYVKKNRQGFTLSELMMAVAIFVLIVGATSVFVIYYFQNYSFSFEENQAIGLSQSSFTTMIRELREARNGEDGAWPLSQTDDNEITFFADVTNDGKSDKVRYFLAGSELKKGVIEPTNVPVNYPAVNEKITTIAYYVDNLTKPVFKYFNGSYPSDTVNNPLVVNARILYTRYIEIYLRINISSNSGAQPFEMNSGVQIRSLKDNL